MTQLVENPVSLNNTGVVVILDEYCLVVGAIAPKSINYGTVYSVLVVSGIIDSFEIQVLGGDSLAWHFKAMLQNVLAQLADIMLIAPLSVIVFVVTMI